MSNKILYSPKEGTTGFWWMRDVPEEPEYCTGFDDRYCELCQREAALSCNYKKQQYNAALESCKSNKLEIIGMEDLPMSIWDSFGKHLTDGTIFDLPIGYRLQPEGEFFRLVKVSEWIDIPGFPYQINRSGQVPEGALSQPEPEESQIEVCQKVIDDILKFQSYNKTTEHALNHLIKNFIIQRKKQ